MTHPSDPSTAPDLPSQSNTSSDAWDPITISNIILSVIMVSVAIIAIWQAHCHSRPKRHTRDLDEEIIDIRILSRTSTASSGNPANLNCTPPSSQVALTANEDQDDIEALTPADRVDTLDGTPIGMASCV